MEQATVRPGRNLATAQARTTSAGASAKWAAAAGNQAGRRAGGAPKSAGATDTKTSGETESDLGDSQRGRAGTQLVPQLVGCAAHGDARRTRFPDHEAMVPASGGNTSNLVRNFSDQISREWVRGAPVWTTEQSVDMPGGRWNTSAMVAEASIVALRGWEFACIATWAVGLWLVFRLGGNRLYLGLYGGASLLAFWDWMLGNRWFFDITFDDRFVTLFRVDGLVEPVWAGFSYGFFFGICALLAVHFGRRLDERLGAWQYPLIAVGLGFLDIVIEGISVGWLDLYRFNYRESYLWWGVPWTNIVFIVGAQMPIIFLARRLAELVERIPDRSPAFATAGDATRPDAATDAAIGD